MELNIVAVFACKFVGRPRDVSTYKCHRARAHTNTCTRTHALLLLQLTMFIPVWVDVTDLSWTFLFGQISPADMSYVHEGFQIVI